MNMYAFEKYLYGCIKLTRKRIILCRSHSSFNFFFFFCGIYLIRQSPTNYRRDSCATQMNGRVALLKLYGSIWRLRPSFTNITIGGQFNYSVKAYFVLCSALVIKTNDECDARMPEPFISSKFDCFVIVLFWSKNLTSYVTKKNNNNRATIFFHKFLIFLQLNASVTVIAVHALLFPSRY